MMREFIIKSFFITFFSMLSSAAHSDEKISVGISVPLTGGAATYGTDILNGIQFANKHLFDDKFNLIVENDECSNKVAVSIAKKFISSREIKYVLGLPCSSAVLSTAPLYEKNKIVVISAGAAAPTISQSGDYIFRTFPSSDEGSIQLYRYLTKRHKKIGIVSEQTDYAQGVLSGFLNAQSEKKEIEIVQSNYLPGESDLRGELLRLKSENIEGIILNPQNEDKLITLVKQAHQLGFTIPVYGFIYPSSPAFLSAAGSFAEGIIFPDTPSTADLDNQKFNDIVKLFKSNYSNVKSSEFYILTSILSLQALDQALKLGVNVQQNLVNYSFDGIHGPFSFTKSGDIQGFGYVLKIIRDGRPELLEK